MVPFRIVLSLGLVLFLPLAGCLGGDEASPPASPRGQTPDDPPAGTSIPATPEPTTRVKVDPNGTFEGGAHSHDHWGAEREITILDRDLGTGPADVCAGAGPTDTTEACFQGERFIRFESAADPDKRPNLVFPGTGRMTIDVQISGEVLQPFLIALQAPNRAPAFSEAYKVDKKSLLIEIDGVLENQTDLPHFRSSSWMFRLQAAPAAPGAPAYASLYSGQMHWKVTVHRSDRSLPIDPPHPDLWGGESRRILYDATHYHNTTHVSVGASFNSGMPTDLVFPVNSTILPGTHKLIITLEWTNAAPVPTALGAQYRSANECNCIGFVPHRPEPASASASNRVYEIEVRPDEWDSPYSTVSRWGIRWYFDNEQVDNESGILREGAVHWTLEITKL